MAKDPAFLFYSKDWVEGTTILTFEERGKFIHILAIMHQQGRLDEETICFLVGSVSVKLKSKFKIDENGLWYNEKLEKETEKRNIFIQSRQENGKKGGRPKTYEKPSGKPLGKARDNLPANAIENENVIKNSKEGVKGEEVFGHVAGVKPGIEDLGHPLPEIRVGMVVQYFVATKQIEVKNEQVLGLWEVFKGQYFNGKHFHKDWDDVYSHFLNWSYKQKISNGTTKNSNTTGKRDRNTSTNEFADKVHAEYLARYGGNGAGKI